MYFQSAFYVSLDILLFHQFKMNKKNLSAGKFGRHCHFISMDLKFRRLLLHLPQKDSHRGKGPHTPSSHIRHWHPLLLLIWSTALSFPGDGSQTVNLLPYSLISILILEKSHGQTLVFWYLVGYLEYLWVWCSIFDDLFINLYSWVPSSFRWFDLFAIP